MSNALWDMYAKARGKPLWKLICDFTPEEWALTSCPRYAAYRRRFVKAVSWRYITDALTPAEALALLKKNEAGKKAREEEVMRRGYPAYTTSVGWLGKSTVQLAISLTTKATRTKRLSA